MARKTRASGEAPIREPSTPEREKDSGTEMQPNPFEHPNSTLPADDCEVEQEAPGAGQAKEKKDDGEREREVKRLTVRFAYKSSCVSGRSESFPKRIAKHETLLTYGRRGIGRRAAMRRRGNGR